MVTERFKQRPCKSHSRKRCEGAERLVVAAKSLIKGWSQGAVFMWTGALDQPAMGGAGESAETETVLYFQA
jgi:hypothetical protein